MMTDIDSIFGTQAFETVEIRIQAQNAMTGIQAPKEPPIEICEISSEQLVIDISHKLCAPGHHLLLEVEATLPGEKSPFKIKMTARVQALEAVGEGRDRVQLIPVQFEEKQFERLLGYMSARQEAISNFLISARGY